MDRSTFVDRWQREQRRARRTAIYTKWWIWGGLALGGLSLLQGLIQAIQFLEAAHRPNGTIQLDGRTGVLTPEGQSIIQAFGFISLLICAVNGFLIYLVIKRVFASVAARRGLVEDPRFVKLSSAGIEAITAELKPMCERLGLQGTDFWMLRPKASSAYSPSVVEVQPGIAILVVPPDFLTLVGTRPEAARAMLAHEVGHLVQKDTDLWLFATAYAEELLGAFLPFHLGVFLLYFITALCFGATGSMGGLFAFLAASATGLVGMLALFYFFYRIRRYRRRSEELADLAAWIATSDDGAGLLDCFRIQKEKPAAPPTAEDALCAFGFFGETVPRRFVMKIHPSPDQRLKQVEHYNLVAAGRSRRLKIVSQFSLGSLAILLPVFAVVMAIVALPVFAQAKDAARRASALSNAKQLGMGAMIYMADYDDCLPRPPDQATLKAVMYPYMKHNELWVTENRAGEEFEMNSSLAGTYPNEVENVAEAILYMDPSTWPDGRRTVCFADGHANLVRPERWPRYEPSLHLKLTQVEMLPSVMTGYLRNDDAKKPDSEPLPDEQPPSDGR